MSNGLIKKEKLVIYSSGFYEKTKMWRKNKCGKE